MVETGTLGRLQSHGFTWIYRVTLASSVLLAIWNTNRCHNQVMEKPNDIESSPLLARFKQSSSTSLRAHPDPEESRKDETHYILTEEMVEVFISKILKKIEELCPGPKNKRVCKEEFAKVFCLEDLSYETPPTNYTKPFTPWLTSGDLHWTANDHIDFLSWYIFFSGKVAFDKERPANAGPLTYFESGAQNGIWSSNTYTIGEQMGWEGLLVEPSNCGACDVPMNRPKAQSVHAGLCPTDSTMPVPTGIKSFCVIPYPCTTFPEEVPCHTLKTLFANKNKKVIDYFSLDIEDFTLDAWNSLDHSETDIRHGVVEKRSNIRPTSFDASQFHVKDIGNDYFIWKRDAFVLVDKICPVFLF